MRSYKRYTRRKRLLKQIAVVALVFILGFVLLRAVSYMAIQGEIPMINSFNLFRREADTSFGWNLILVNDDYCVPRNYEVELTELSNGEKVDSRIYPQLQQISDLLHIKLSLVKYRVSKAKELLSKQLEEGRD